jgi:glycine/D-amino acid oxidase-like deaminating enzyme
VSERAYDVVVAGGGIAGLAAAEIFARSGQRALLLERNERLCQETSGRHHEWFHFGSLYSIFPHNQHLRTMVGGIDDLLDYYADFPGLNLRVAPDGQLVTDERAGGWLRDERIEYVVSATNDPDFSLRRARDARDWLSRLSMGLAWDWVIKQFVSRHNRFYKHDWRRKPASRYIPAAGIWDYSRRNIEKFRDPDVRLDPDTHFKIRGYDRPFNAQSVVSDLVRSLLSAGGEVRTGAEFARYARSGGELRVEFSAGDAVVTRKLLIATGKGLRQHLAGRLHVEVVVSPLLVAFPHVCGVNFARLTPFMSETVNHLKHPSAQGYYSLIGGGYFAKPDDAQEVQRAGEALRARALQVFPRLEQAQLLDTYFSHKTEITGGFRKRNYQYRIENIDEDVYSLLPGKFSLAFSLAVNAYMQIAGGEPNRRARFDASVDVNGLVAPMAHRRMVAEFVSARAARAVPA